MLKKSIQILIISNCWELEKKKQSDSFTPKLETDGTNVTNLLLCLFWPVFEMQYNLDFRGLSPRGRSPRGDDDSAISGTEGGKSSGGAGGDPSIWQFGMARRGKGDSRRTRVSFLLFWASSTTSTTRFTGLQQRTLVQPFFFSVWHYTMLLNN